MTEYDDLVDSIRVDEVLDALGVDVSHIRNGNHWGDCPIHDDTGGHFSIDEDSLVWNCFHCGGGILPQLVIRAEGFEDGEVRAWDQAIEWLLPYSDGEPDSLTDDQFLEQVERNLAKAEMDSHIERWGDLPVYSERLLKDLQEVPLEVLNKWNIFHQAAARTFKIGYDPEHSKGTYTGPALVIPHFFKGKFVGYQERWLGDDRPRWLKKYMNTDDFPRQETLYNWDRARKSGDFVIVVESVMSVVRLWELGYEAVATFGAKVTDTQIRLLKTIEKGIYLSFDNDKDGRSALARCSAHLMGEVPVWTVPFVDSNKGDLADLPDQEVVDLIDRSRVGILL